MLFACFLASLAKPLAFRAKTKNQDPHVVKNYRSWVYTCSEQQGDSVDQSARREFERFVHEVEPSLRRALIAAYGIERGRDAAAEALGWAWENWDRAKDLESKVAYLFRVGQSKTRGHKTPIIFERITPTDRWFEPSLAPALAELTEHQRVAVVLVHGFGWKLREVAELLGVSISTTQSHVERGLRNLQNTMEVRDNA
jgi:DNA-directed RNA polymerase specialized sigma24 family protein